jgi:hypothetical protein
MKKIIAVIGVVFLVGSFAVVRADADTTPPVITLLGSASLSIVQGTSYTDAGATASDDVDGDITSHIAVVNPVDTNTVGTYSVAYDVSDTAGNPAIEVTRSVSVTPTPPPPTETVLIRNGATVIFQGTIALPASGTVSIPDDTGTTHNVNAKSVLGVLYALDQAHPEFEVSDLQYYNSFGAFYLKCITPSGGTASCDNWQFVVNNSTPWTSMDTTILSGGENLGFYFGNPHQVTFDTNAISAGGSVTATAQKYNYLDDTWSALTGVTIGATQPNPSDPYNPTVVTSGAVDSTGSTVLTLAIAGTYDVGISEDYYFPTYPVTVNSVGGGGGGGSAVFSVPNAISYLTSQQAGDGSLGGSDLYTDWAGIALSAGGASSQKSALISYLNSHNNLSGLLTDNERRAMSLLSLGQNPYSFGGVDYITAIVNRFDGTQFGDASLTNDDIFALIPLSKAGYTSGDEIISKDVTFILSKQQSNGSWENSVDMTSAGVQALAPFSGVSGVSNALTNAGNYLQNNQGNDGGWGNVSSSSWAIQAMNVLGASWTKSGKSTADYLAGVQVSDGATSPTSETVQNRIWSTSYAIPAGLGKSWFSIMQGVSKPTTSGSAGGNISNDTGDSVKKSDKDILTIPDPKMLKIVEKTDITKVEEQKPVLVLQDILPKKEAKIFTSVHVEPRLDTEIPNLGLTASVGNSSGTTPNGPIVLASLSGLSLLFFVVRRFIW